MGEAKQHIYKSMHTAATAYLESNQLLLFVFRVTFDEHASCLWAF